MVPLGTAAVGTAAAIGAVELRVAAIAREAEAILAFELAHPGGAALPAFTAGAHVDVILPNGIRRQYSLCNDPRERHRYIIAVLKETAGRGGSKAMHDGVAVGDRLTVSTPRNNFPLAGDEARFHLLLAGGIGVTPMLAMIAALEARGAAWRMHYCTRGPERTAFAARLAPLIAAGKVRLHHDGGDPSRGLDLKALLAERPAGAHVYYCGPPGFMTGAKAAASHWPAEAVHCEYFTAAEDKPAASANTAFQIRIAKTGQVFDVPADRSIVQVLRANGIAIETDCEEGYCGTCVTPWTAGEPEHRDTVLSEADRKRYMMICCGRSKTPLLVLDL